MGNVYEQSIDQKNRTTEEMAKAITTGNENLGKARFKEVEEYDEVPRRSNKVTGLVKSNAKDSVYTTLSANFKISFTRSPFSSI